MAKYIKINPEGILPSGYTLLEYIENGSTQYIDTGLTLNQSDSVKYVIDASFINNDAWGGANAYLQFQASIMGGNRAILCNDYNGSTHIMNTYVNGTIKETRDWSTFTGANVKIAIFKLGDVNNSWYSGSPQSGKVYSVQITKNGVLVRKYIPALRKSDNKIGLYDLQNSKFYMDAAGGNFIGHENNWRLINNIYLKTNTGWLKEE